MPKRRRGTSLPAPYLKSVWLPPDAPADTAVYPFNLPWLGPGFRMSFTEPVTILIGENGTGKSTLVEAIAGLAGYDEAGGGKGYRPVDHSSAVDQSGSALGGKLKAGWLPKVGNGWFFRAESFYSVARYLDKAALDAGEAPPDFLSWSHGEGFVRFFEERMSRQGVYFLDEPESALSPRRQIDLLRALAEIQRTARAQVIMATHSPLLMAVPDASVLEITRGGLSPTDYRETRHFRMYRDFTADPDTFVREMLGNDS
ncbi:MAG: AAA family ATPase [Pseudomonadota bacterium]